MNGQIISIVIHTESIISSSVRVKMENGDVGYFEIKKPAGRFYWDILKELEQVAQDYIDSKNVFGAAYAKKQREEGDARYRDFINAHKKSMSDRSYKPEDTKRVVFVQATDDIQVDKVELPVPNEHGDDNYAVPEPTQN